MFNFDACTERFFYLNLIYLILNSLTIFFTVPATIRIINDLYNFASLVY